jgi:hypothetical protein
MEKQTLDNVVPIGVEAHGVVSVLFNSLAIL